MKNYIVNELELHALAHLSEHAAEALFQDCEKRCELPPNGKWLTRGDVMTAIHKNWPSMLNMLDELFGEESGDAN